MMEQIILIIIIISSLNCFAYLILIASYCYAWVKIKSPIIHDNINKILVTVVIAARNEEDNIETCLTSILDQSYSSEYMEIIIVDDASEDTTNYKIQQFCNKYKNIKLITLDKKFNLSGKKNALNAAINEAKGELIVTTDADCIMSKNWLSTIVGYYNQSHPKMIVSPVSFYNEKTIFEKMQSLELMALVLSSGASLHFNKAIMCNGANLAYPKKVFYEVNSFEGI